MTHYHMMDVVFDIGNVLFEWNPQEIVKSLFTSETEQQEALQHIIYHLDWHMLDKGVLTLEDAKSRANERCSLGIYKVIKLFAETPRHLFPIQEMFNVVEDLSRRGYRLYVLSNMHRHGFDYLSTAYDIWQHFTGIVISSHIKASKPEPEIYEHLIRTYDLTPGNTVFLDDNQPNIDAAISFGLNAILVQDPSQGKDELYQMLGIKRSKQPVP